MIKEEYVTFETAKLLNEAGFPYDDNGPCYEERIGLCGREYYPKPTQAQAMRWLREDIGIILSPNYKYDGAWWFSLESERFNLYKEHGQYFDEHYPSYESAADAGIQAACKYIIEDKSTK